MVRFLLKDHKEVLNLAHGFGIRTAEEKVRSGVEFVLQGICSERTAAKALGIPRDQIRRGVKAEKKGHDVGKVGRPFSLPSVGREKLAAEIAEKIKKKQRPDASAIIADVLKTDFILLSLITLLRPKGLLVRRFHLMSQFRISTQPTSTASSRPSSQALLGSMLVNFHRF